MKMRLAKIDNSIMLMGILCLLLLLPIWWPSSPEKDSHGLFTTSGNGMIHSKLDIDVKPAKADIGDYAAILARPLFIPDRRTYMPVTKTAEKVLAPVAPALPRVQLKGVIMTPEQKIAVLENTPDRKTIYVQQGENISGWYVSKLTKDKIVLSNGDTNHEFLLRNYSSSPGGSKISGSPATSAPGDLGSVLSAIQQNGTH